MATGTKATASTSTATETQKGSTFILNDAELETLKSTRGRKATDSVYLAEVKAAIESGDVCGIRLTAAVKAPYVQAQLRKAAKALGIEKAITVYNREESKSDANPHGFVAYKIVKAEADASE